MYDIILYYIPKYLFAQNTKEESYFFYINILYVY